MAKSSIEWTMEVWNPTTGCNKISQGCKNCYAEKMHKRLMVLNPNKYSSPFLEKTSIYEAALEWPLTKKKGKTIFVNSMSDLFHESLIAEDIAKVYAIMFLTPQHTYQVLTKRANKRCLILNSPVFIQLVHKWANAYHDKFIKKLEREMYLLDEIKSFFPLKNVWEGVSAENKDVLDRIDALRNTPAAVRWISAEPLLEDLGDININGIDWVVVGGESGHKKRPFNSDWARNIREQCAYSGVKFFMKQIDKIQEIPDDLMIREYPNK